MVHSLIQNEFVTFLNFSILYFSSFGFYRSSVICNLSHKMSSTGTKNLKSFNNLINFVLFDHKSIFGPFKPICLFIARSLSFKQTHTNTFTFLARSMITENEFILCQNGNIFDDTNIYQINNNKSNFYECITMFLRLGLCHFASSSS